MADLGRLVVKLVAAARVIGITEDGVKLLKGEEEGFLTGLKI